MSAARDLAIRIKDDIRAVFVAQGYTAMPIGGGYSLCESDGWVTAHHYGGLAGADPATVLSAMLAAISASPPVTTTGGAYAFRVGFPWSSGAIGGCVIFVTWMNADPATAGPGGTPIRATLESSYAPL